MTIEMVIEELICENDSGNRTIEKAAKLVHGNKMKDFMSWPPQANDLEPENF